MKKIAFSAVAIIGSIGSFAVTTPAVAGACEIQHTMAIAACNGNSACGDDADWAYFQCLKRQAEVNE